MYGKGRWYGRFLPGWPFPGRGEPFRRRAVSAVAAAGPNPVSVLGFEYSSQVSILLV